MICMVVRGRRTRRGSWVVAGHVWLVRDLASESRVSARPVSRSENERVGPGRGGAASRRRPREPRVADEHPTPAPSAAKAQRSAAPAAPGSCAKRAPARARSRGARVYMRAIDDGATAGSNVAMCLVSSSSSRGDIVDRILRGRRYTPPNNSIRNAFTVAPLVRQMQASLHPHR